MVLKFVKFKRNFLLGPSTENSSGASWLINIAQKEFSLESPSQEGIIVKKSNSLTDFSQISKSDKEVLNWISLVIHKEFL